jgi:tape measure domain-containing protein
MAFTTAPGAVIRIGVQGEDESIRRIEAVGNSMNGLARTVQTAFRTLAGAIGITGSLAGLVQMSDAYTKYTAQLQLATGSQRELGLAMSDVRRISSQAQQNIAATGTLYARIANGTRELGVAQKQVAAITETVNLALTVSGATATESASAQLQLSQAFASGTLRGEEFNAVNEAAPRLMKALADGIGVPVGALKEMAGEGLITSQIMAEVLPNALLQLREEAKHISTISGAYTVLTNRVMEFVGAQAQSSGSVLVITQTMGALADNLDLVTGAVLTLTAAKLGTWLVSLVGRSLEAIAASRALAATNLATAQAEFAAAAAADRLAIARVAELRGAVIAAEGNVALAITVNGLIPAELNAARTASALTASHVALGVATKAASVGVTVLRGALSFLGGPVGAVITLLGVAAVAWSHWSNKAEEASRDAEAAVEETHSEMVTRLEKQIELLDRRAALLNKVPQVKGASEADQDGLARAKAELDAIQNRTGRWAGESESTRQLAEIDAAERYEKALRLVTVSQKKVKEAAEGTRDTKIAKWYGENGTAAQRLAYELAELKTKFGEIPAEMEKAVRAKYADKAAASATEKEASAYASLISAIRTKTEENRLEAKVGKDATESEKASIKITEQLASGKLKLSAAHRSALEDAVKEQAASEDALKLSAAQADVTKTIAASTVVRGEAAKALQVEYEMYGKTADAREFAMVAVRSEAETEKKLADLREAKLPVTDEIIAKLKEEERARTSAGQATLAQSKALQYAASLKEENKTFAIEAIADPRARASAQLEKDAALWRERLRLATEGTAAQKQLQTEYDIWYKNQQSRVLVEVDLTRATELLKIFEAIDEAARQAAAGMEASFGRVGAAIGGLTTSLSGYERAQAAVSAQLAASMKDANGDPAKIAKAQALAAQQGAKAQVSSYGDMAAAAKGFFKENTKGYKTLETTEKAFRAIEMAMAIQSMVQKLFTVNTVTTATVMGEATKAAAVQAGTVAQVAADGVKGASAAAVGVATQAQGDPYSAFARMAAMAAAMAALGFTVFGGGGGSGKSISQQRQESQGTGSVFGDSTAKSDSIARSLELVSNNSSIELSYTQGMLASLRSIESSLDGLGGVLVRNSGLTTSTIADKASAAQDLFMVMQPFWSIGAKTVGNLVGKAFGGKTTVQDTGFTIDPTTLAGAMSVGVKSFQYADIKKDGGWFKSDKYSTEKTALDSEANSQFSKVIASLGAGVSEAAKLLGLGGDEFTAKLNNFVIDIGKISLKDMDSDKIQEAIESVFSKLGDDMATYAVGSLDAFAKIGEGPLETLTRIASDYANLNSILASSGTSFGQVGMASITARERLIALAGGIDELASAQSSFNDNFLTEAERLAPVQKYVTDQLAALGLQGIDTRDKFKDVVLSLANSGALATEAGAAQYTALLALADAFAKTHAATEDLTKSEQEIADERKDLAQQLADITKSETELLAIQRAGIADVNKALFDQVQAAKAVVSAKDALATAYDREATAAKTAIEKSKAWVVTLNGLNANLALSSQSTLTPEQKYAEARAQFEKTLAAAKAGDTAAQSGLSAAEQAFLTASQVVNASDAKYAADYARVVAANEEAAKWAQTQVDLQQASYDALEAQVKGLVTINDSVLTVAQAIANLQSAMGVTDNMGVKFTNVPAVTAMAVAAPPIDFSRYQAGSSAGTEVMAAAIKALQEEVKGLRADQARQTGALIQSNDQANAKAADKVVDGVQKSATASAWASAVKGVYSE